MATFIPGITDAVPETPMYHPDFGYFNQMLSKKTQQYNQGFSQVQNAYSSVLNAQLSDQANIPLRDQYVKQAQDKLKELSSSDLSLDSNVQSAQDVFSPFWSDDLMLKDVAYTKGAQAEIQKGLAMRDSKDEKEREQYDPAAMLYITQGLDKLKRAGRDESAYSKLETRRFVPMQNISAILSKAAKDEGYENVNETSKDGYLVKQVNGVRTITNFRTWAEGKQTPQMMDQFKVLGSVENQGRIDNYRRKFPNATDEQAQEAIAKDAVLDYTAGYKKTIDSMTSYKSQLESRLAVFNTLPGDHKASLAQEAEIAQIREQILNTSKGIVSQQEQMGHYNEGGVEYEKLHAAIVANPDHYFTSIIKNQTLDNWAAGAASNEKTTYTEDPVLKTKTENAYKQMTYDLEVSKFHEDVRNHDEDRKVKISEINAKLLTGDGSGSTGMMLDQNGNIIPNSNSITTRNLTEQGHKLGPDTENIDKGPTPAVLYAQAQLDKTYLMNDLVASADGVAKTLTTLDPSFTSQDLVYLTNGLKKKLSDPDHTGYTNDEQAAMAKIQGKLEATTGIKITGPGSFRNAIMSYTGKYFADRSSNTAVPLTAEERNTVQQYGKATELMDQLSSDKRIRDQLTNKILNNTKDPALLKAVITRPDGSKDMVNSDDVAKDFSNLSGRLSTLIKSPSGNNAGSMFMNTLLPGDLNSAPKLTAKKMAEAFVAGTMKIDYQRGRIEGKSDRIRPASASIKIGDASYDVPTDLVQYVQKIQEKYGESGQFSKALTQLNTGVIPNLPSYNSKTGNYGYVTQYDVPNKDPKGGPSKATRVLQELGNSQNVEATIYDGKLSNNEDINNAVKMAVSQSQDGEHKFINGIKVHTRGFEGKKTVEVQFSSTLAKDDNRSFNGVAMKDLAGHKIEFVVSPTAEGENVRSVFHDSGTYVYAPMMNGKAYKSSDLQKNTNYNYTVTPDHNNQGVFVDIKRKVFKNGQLVDIPFTPFYVPFNGPNAKSPDEIMSTINQGYDNHMTEDQNNRKVYQNNIPIEQTSGKTFRDLLN
jgi:hypothetical protein